MTGTSVPGAAGAAQPASQANLRVLIVDDQAEIHDDFREMLQPPNPVSELVGLFESDRQRLPVPFLPPFELLHAATGEQACELVLRARQRGRPIAVAYIDVRMPPGIDGIETVRRIRRIDRDLEIVIMTAYSDRSLPEIVQDMELLHKLIYIRKPFVHEEIQQLTLCLAGKWNVERELAGNHRRLQAVLDATGDAIAMVDLAERLVFANRHYEKLLDLNTQELKKLTPEALTARFEERFREPDASDLQHGFLLYQGAAQARGSSGALAPRRLFSRFTTPVRDGAGKVTGTLLVYRDVSKEIEAEHLKAEVLRIRGELDTSYSFAGVVGASPGMRRVHTLIRQAAEGDITVLIRGESGTGKELVAKAFHSNSPRSDGPFVALDCASIPEALIESELFGHERGAFTGAAIRHVGAFERASGGTILLDEIGDMPHALQARLLRVLQEREIRRVGGTSAIPVDIRVITSTNKNLERAVRQGEFREDLFYRISAFPILIPPLRDRREDVPLLASHFLDKHTARAGRSVAGISAAAMRILLQYRWPGNVRELENTIERAVLLETEPVLQAGNLPRELSSSGAAAAESAYLPAIQALPEIERQVVLRAFEWSDHSVTRAAHALGISRSTLYRKLRKYGYGMQ